MSEKKYLTPRELIERWGGAICLGTLANWRAKGEGPEYVKIGKKVVYKIESVEKWEEKNGVSQ